MTPVVQSPSSAGRILSLLEGEADDQVTELRLAIAYVTLSGIKMLIDTVAARIGPSWPAVTKQLITCVDFGLTDPDAIEYWLKLPNASALLHNTKNPDPFLRPPTAFHAKYYEFRRPASATLVIGSANLSKAALSRNFETALKTELADGPAVLDARWALLTKGAVAATNAVISAYAIRRERIRIPVVNTVYLAQPPGPRLWDAIDANQAQPSDFEYFWVDAGSMTSGGSHNQLELPRGGHRFFGGMADYNKESKKIIDIDILAPDGPVERPISWHGSNRMERLNLPTGEDYAGRVVLFQRTQSQFQLRAISADGPEAQSWIDRSSAYGHYFRIGRNSSRRCGFFH